MTDPPYTKNRSERAECRVCLNDGWVILNGRETHLGLSYSRGSAPCHWCEAGTAAYTAAKKRKDNVESNYRITDVEGYDPQPVFPTKKEAAEMLRSIMPNLSLEHSDPERYGKSRSPFDDCTHNLEDDGAPQARPWNKDSIQWRRCTKCDMQTAQPVELLPSHSPRRLRP